MYKVDNEHKASQLFKITNGNKGFEASEQGVMTKKTAEVGSPG